MKNQVSTIYPLRHDEDDAEIDLSRYVGVLWRRRVVIGLVTAVCGLLTFLSSLRSTPTYEATAQLVVSQSKVAEGPNAALSMANFKVLVDGQSLAAQVLREFNLDKAPYNLRLSSFLGEHVVSEIVRDTNVIAVKVRLPDPAMAARVANRYLELVVQLAQRLSQDESAVARDFLKVQLDQARERLAAAEDKLDRFKKEAQIDLVREDVNALLGERGRLMALTVEIEGERARLAKAEQEFGRQARVRTERSALDVGSDLRQAAREDQKDPATPPGFQLRSESLSPFINPVYEILDEQIALTGTSWRAWRNNKTS